MSAKGELTRRNIIEKSLQLFSVKGYFNTSISDILQTTGLTKGGLYCHFKSKEEVWYAVYEDAATVWRTMVFKDVRSIGDPLKRIERTIENVLLEYLGREVFDGGCFFVNMLVELSGQSDTMGRHILKGFVGFSKLFQSWLGEAERVGLLKPDLNYRAISDFIIIALNGAATLYMSTREGNILHQANDQLRFFIGQLRE
ncbi:TetR/AcrR family transcriptional regulator [Desulfosarcina cetonica]|uniref:TetR/AcrR family transcriptional regulator n=1 Tax=Desulfosarcina cetonica TaxID=90730 RepID=UPI0006D18EF5|nr:TetR/AcrR family transcriptional regulator [Desulfosarcina cetonica]